MSAPLENLLLDLHNIIDLTHKSIASAVNTGLTMLYWRVGNRIRKEIPQDEQAEYGQEIVVSLARQLVLEIANRIHLLLPNVPKNLSQIPH